jgi:DNA polymerase III sliding clamp (beta) subunit (PCNA family)|tara:strand:- start:277 stop:822 length:546 start_codon:yes stop_codon:yes gene_type:complete
MKLSNPYCKLEKVVSKKQNSRFNTRQIKLDKENNRLIATNGRSMAVLKVETNDNDIDGIIDVDTYKVAKRKENLDNGKVSIELLEDNLAKIGKRKIEENFQYKEEFPPYKPVLEKVKDNEGIEVTLNPRLLIGLIESLGAIAPSSYQKEHNASINIKISGHNEPVVVTCGENIGVVMPKAR